MKKQLIVDWITASFGDYSRHISRIAIYGSMARNVENPNDCDLLIVTLANVESQPWFFLRQHISLAKIDFLKKFKLPLNVALLTDSEWDENQSLYKDVLPIKFEAA